MIVATGVDLIEIARIERLWRHGGERFLQRVFTAQERAYCLGKARPAAALAARFCAKEAVMKCLGTGWGHGVGFRAIEVVRDDQGVVAITLHDRASAAATARGIARIHLSLSHIEQTAIAVAIAEA